MPQVIKTPNGNVTFPDEATPEEIAAALNSVDVTTNRRQMTHGKSLGLDIENPLVTVGKAIPRGAVKAGEFLSQMAMDMGEGATGGAYPPNILPKVPSIGERLIPTADNAHPFFNTAGEGLGGGVVFGPSSPVRSGIVGALSTGGGALGGALGGPAGALGGSLLTGMAAGGLVGPRQSQAQGALKRATEGMSPEDWQAASENLGKYASSGATTGTLPEMFPGNTRLLTLALEARNSRGGEKLSSQVAQRNADLVGLTNRAIEVSGEPGVPADVTNTTRAVANAVIDRAKKARSNDYSSTISGATIPSEPISALREIFLTNAKASESEVERDAYLAAARALTDANPGTALKTSIIPGTSIGKAGFRTAAQSVTTEVPVDQAKTSLEAVAKDLKQMQEKVNDLNLTGGQKLDKGAVNRRYGEVQDFLKALSPQYQRAEAGYRSTSENVVDPLISGPIGDLSGRNPNSRVDPAASILTNLVKDQTPESIPTVMSTLQSGAQLPSQLLPQIARTLVAQKLQKGPLNASQAIRGTPGSAEEASVRALLEGANVDPKPLMDTLDTSALLQTPQFRSAPSTTGEVPQATMGLRIPNMARIASGLSDKFLGTAVQNRYYRQISELLADPSPQALTKLQEIAMYDPHVRQQIAIRAALGANANQEQ